MSEGLLSLSLAGSAAILLWQGLYALTRDRLSSLWHYRLARLCLLFSLAPVGALWQAVRSALPPAPASAGLPYAALPATDAALLPPAAGAAAPAAWAAPELLPSPGMVRAALGLWAVGALVLLLYKALRFSRFRRRLLESCQEAELETQAALAACMDRLNVRRAVAVRVSPLLRTSLVMGPVRPVIVLPACFTQEDLRYVLSHELTHVKHHDLWVRRLSLAVRALHWWNPLMLLLDCQIERLSEQACDERVAAPLSRQERYAYGRLLLAAAADAAAARAGAAMLSTRETLQRRLMRMLHVKKATSRQRLLSLLLTAALLACGTAGALAAEAVPLSAAKIPAIPAAAPAAPEHPAAWRTDGAVWFAPEDIRRLQDARLAGPDGVIRPLLDPAAPAYLEQLLQSAAPAGAGETVPGYLLYLLRSDGTVGKLLLPQADADLFHSDGRAYRFSGGKALRALFGLAAEDAAAALPPAPAAQPRAEKPAAPAASAEARDGEVRDGEGHLLYTLTPGGEKVYTDYYQTVYRPARIAEIPAAALDMLVDGDYPRNSRGETYGPEALHWVTGYQPDLLAAQGDGGQSGYIREAELEAVPTDLPKETCPHAFSIPLYDCEGTVIGAFPASCGGHAAPGPSVTAAEAKAALGLEGAKSPEADPSDSRESLVVTVDGVDVRIYPTNHGNFLLPQLFDSLSDDKIKALAALPDGRYPKNSLGQSYGDDTLAAYLQEEPDLVACTNEEGLIGYLWWEDQKARFMDPDVLARYEWTEEGCLLPLYDAEHRQIGTCSKGVYLQGIRVTRDNVAEVIAALRDGRMP